MKNFWNKLAVFGVAALMIGALTSACKDDEPVPPEPTEDVFPIRNHAMPRNPQMLKVLAIGNSFSVDGLRYLATMIDSAGLIDRVCFETISIGGAGLQFWNDVFVSDKSCNVLHYAGKLVMPVREAPVSQIVSQDWDVVVFQQVSNLSHDYDSYNPYLRNLISKVKSLCPNPNVTFAWQQTWSYSENFTEYDQPKEYEGWKMIVEATEAMVKNEGIDVVIPCGTTVELVRSSPYNTSMSLTLDGRHMGYGVGRYVVAATWFQSLLSDVFDVSVLGNGARLTQPAGGEAWPANFQDVVDDSNAYALQELVVQAVNDRTAQGHQR